MVHWKYIPYHWGCCAILLWPQMCPKYCTQECSMYCIEELRAMISRGMLVLREINNSLVSGIFFPSMSKPVMTCQLRFYLWHSQSYRATLPWGFLDRRTALMILEAKPTHIFSVQELAINSVYYHESIGSKLFDSLFLICIRPEFRPELADLVLNVLSARAKTTSCSSQLQSLFLHLLRVDRREIGRVRPITEMDQVLASAIEALVSCDQGTRPDVCCILLSIQTRPYQKMTFSRWHAIQPSHACIRSCPVSYLQLHAPCNSKEAVLPPWGPIGNQSLGRHVSQELLEDP